LFIPVFFAERAKTHNPVPEGGRERGVAAMNNAKHTLDCGQGVWRLKGNDEKGGGQTLSLNIQELLLCFISARKMKSSRLPRRRT